MKLALSILSLFALLPHAQAMEDEHHPFKLDCQSSNASLHIAQTATGLFYDVKTPSKNTAGFALPHSTNGDSWEESGATLIDPEYAPGDLYLSVVIDGGKKVWNPPHSGCLPTRNENESLPVTVPGDYSNVVQDWIDIMVNVTDKTHPTFMSLDVGKGFEALGDADHPMVCTTTDL